MTPHLWVIAGPNGAGKTTLVQRYIAGRLPVVNPDELAKQIDPANPDDSRVMLQAARQAITERDGHIAGGRSFAMETTLTGKSELAVMRSAGNAGFKVNLIYIGLDDVDLSAGRVAERVQAGGHNVPSFDLQRRFPRSLANLPVAMELADRTLLLDNAGRRRRLVLSVEHGRAKYTAAMPPEWARDALRRVPGLARGVGR